MLYNASPEQKVFNQEQAIIMEAKVRRQIILLSILLHILFLAFWESSLKMSTSRMQPQPLQAQNAPLVFDLVQPDLPQEVIATPADAKTTEQPKNADFLSDKNALARNQEPAPEVTLGNAPFARGDIISHDLPPQPASPQKETAAARSKEKRAEEKTESPRLQSGEVSRIGKSPFQLPLPGVRHDYRDSRVPDSGGLSFNTYNWDFAPYMLELKERISRNIFPPLAFSQLGMIDGDTLLRFKIYPNGELHDLELLAYQGHRSLMETSTLAVKVSAPFRKLPGNFPEPFLQVTAKFSFFIKNKRG
jgi:hypothetical protein